MRVNGEALTKASRLIDAAAAIEAEAEHPYVSRGGVKLAAALDHFTIDPIDRICLDVGASTGGFTDLLLKRGARFVHAIDVGHDQFHPSLRADLRVDVREGCDARTLSRDDFKEAPSLIVIDVSFISLTLIIPKILSLAASQSFLVALIKPQFEVGPRGVGKGGIVRDEDARAEAVAAIEKWIFSREGWSLLGTIPSPIAGGDGNVEYLLAAAKA